MSDARDTRKKRAGSNRCSSSLSVGSTQYWPPSPTKRVSPPSELKHRTYSAALLNALEIRTIPIVTFVGEPTGGRPNSYGQVQSFALPNSGLIVSYSSQYF